MHNNFYDFIQTSVNELKEKELYRSPFCVSGRACSEAQIDKKTLIQMNSNNYLGLAGDKRLEAAMIQAASEYGVGATGSRLISGTHRLHQELETKIAELKQTEKALVFATGYMANVGTLSAILSENDAVYSDELNHASIIDGIKLSRASKFIYRHNDVSHLEELLAQNSKNYRFNMIVTDTVFSMDGDRAKLKEIVELKKAYNTVLYIDEAHAFGVYGSNGEGLAHELGISGDVDIQMGTLSKAAGSEGGYIACKAVLAEFILNKARSFVFSTAPAMPAIAASIAAVQTIRDDVELRAKLQGNIQYFKTFLKEVSEKSYVELIPSESAIFCLNVGDNKKTLEFSSLLYKKYGIWATAIRPPTVKTSRIRFCVNALHSHEQLKYVAESVAELATYN